MISKRVARCQVSSSQGARAPHWCVYALARPLGAGLSEKPADMNPLQAQGLRCHLAIRPSTHRRRVDSLSQARADPRRPLLTRGRKRAPRPLRAHRVTNPSSSTARSASSSRPTSPPQATSPVFSPAESDDEEEEVPPRQRGGRSLPALERA